MKEFKIGQRVQIVNEEVASEWEIKKLLGTEFVVDSLHEDSDGSFAAKVGRFYVPAGACKLVEGVPQTNNIAESANLLQKVCHTASYDAGWWPASIRDNPLTFSNKLMLIVSEIAEAMEGDRKDCMDDKLPHRKMAEVELADAVIRIMDLSGAYGYDIGGATVEKMEFNRSRIDHSKGAREAVGGKKY